MKVIHIPGLPPMYTNTYLMVSDGGHAAVIDPAGSLADYRQVLKENNAQLTYILLTHGHYDHVGTVEALKAATGAAVYLDTRDAQGNHYFPLDAAVADAAYTDGGKLPLDELTITTWHTPGHTQGSWCLRCEEFLFTGDTLFCGSIGRTDLPGGDMNQMNQSLKKLAQLPLADEVNVLPGHESFSTMGAERRRNYYLRQFAHD